MRSGIQARPLDARDAAAVAAVYGSRGKLMLRPKGERQRAFGERFPEMLEKGCEAYGTFLDGQLQAFCVFYPWADLPFSTCVLMQSRPLPGPVNLMRNGIASALDAALGSLEARGYSHIVFRRIVDGKWRKDAILRHAGRARAYSYSLVEVVRAGGASSWDRINRAVLNNQPVEHDTAIVIAVKPEET